MPSNSKNLVIRGLDLSPRGLLFIDSFLEQQHKALVREKRCNHPFAGRQDGATQMIPRAINSSILRACVFYHQAARGAAIKLIRNLRTDPSKNKDTHSLAEWQEPSANTDIVLGFVDESIILSMLVFVQVIRHRGLPFNPTQTDIINPHSPARSAHTQNAPRFIKHQRRTHT
jgi:hypothetical protein